MSQIRPTLDKALPEQLPPTSWDSHDLEARAVRSIRRRQIGGGVLAVVLLGVMSVVVTTLFPFTGTDTPAGGTPSFPLPRLDADQQYDWILKGGSQTGATEKINAEFWDYLAEHHPDLKPDKSGRGDAAVLRSDRQLWTVTEQDGVYDVGNTGSKRVYRQPVYTLTPTPGKRGLDFRSGASETEELLTLDVYPKDGFEPGAADVSADPGLPPRPEFLVEGCEDYKQDDDAMTAVEFSCSKPEATTRQEALAVKRTVHHGRDEIQVTNTVVLYREDGTAVAVSMNLTASKATDPALSTAEMLRIAEAIPDVPVT